MAESHKGSTGTPKRPVPPVRSVTSGSSPPRNGSRSRRKISRRRGSRRSALVLKPGVDAPRASSRESEIKEDKAIKYRPVAPIEDGEESVRKMADEIGECHLARHDEG